MASSQALHPCAVYTICSKSLYEHGFYFHPADPFLVCLSCLSAKCMRGTNEVEGRGERGQVGVGWRLDTSGMRLLLGFVSVKPHAFNRGGRATQCSTGLSCVGHGLINEHLWCKPTSEECSVAPGAKLCSKQICFLYSLMLPS